jgi:hypothetical protein
LLGRAEHVAVALLRAPRAAAELASHVAVELRELALPDIMDEQATPPPVAVLAQFRLQYNRGIDYAIL